MSLLALLDGKDVQVGVIDVASDEVETPERGRRRRSARRRNSCRASSIIAGTNCGMAPMRWDIALRQA